MSAETLASDAQRPDGTVVRRAARVLADAGLIVLPTDTVYGLACRADSEAAVQRLFEVKRRSREKALPLLLAAADCLGAVAVDVPATAQRLARAFWPGPLTLVVRKATSISDLVTGGRGTVGVRVPDLPLAQAILAACDFPVAVTSANLADEPPATAAAALPPQLRAQVTLIVDGGPCRGGQASTVVDVTVDPPAILRPGPVSSDELQTLLGRAR